MEFKKSLLIFILVFISLSIQNAFADTIAKEETTPPPPEVALTADQIPPITKIGKTMPAQGVQPSTTNVQSPMMQPPPAPQEQPPVVVQPSNAPAPGP